MSGVRKHCLVGLRPGAVLGGMSLAADAGAAAATPEIFFRRQRMAPPRAPGAADDLDPSGYEEHNGRLSQLMWTEWTIRSLPIMKCVLRLYKPRLVHCHRPYGRPDS